MAFNTFSLPRVQNSFQFMPYGGPPEPKPPSQRPPSKFPASSEQGNKVDLVNVLGEIETVDLTNFTDNEGDVEISCNGVESGEVRDDDGSGASVLTSREDAGDEVSRQPVPHESCSQGTALVIDDSRSDLELDSDDLDDENAGLHQGDRLEFPSAPTIESYDEEVSVEGIDAIDSETADGEKTNASGPPHWRSSSTPPTSPSIMDIQEHRTEKRLEREVRAGAAAEATPMMSTTTANVRR
ncbi:hypothetical protein EJ04DRAFT_140408 [Polyplosphaeria fusca]|uniref:Uncharacterized protein n=1 Tax=Polyplosphaeria fusca TaxID=682080 RepID=A0A9P4QHB6_9PLEO|nr:hypothetical protein EJ04DRAFT_140408 [Polyplosphaeria fusca]